MTWEIGLMLAVILLALISFSIERIPTDVTGIGLLLVIVILGLLPPQTAIAGFGSETVIMILGLLVLTASVIHTGVVDILGQKILSYVGDQKEKLVQVIMGAGAALSAFISNTGSTALLLPVTLGISRKARISPSKLLMPLAFASILASSVTLIGTSTNLVISGIMTSYGMAPIGMFELTVVGIPILIIGLVYMIVIGIKLIPERKKKSRTMTEQFKLQPYLAEVEILESSSLVGKSLAESDLGRDWGLTVVRIQRQGEKPSLPTAEMVLEVDDRMIVEGSRDMLLSLSNSGEFRLIPPSEIHDSDIKYEDIELFEVILLPRSTMIGRTLAGLNFRDKYDIQVLGISQHGTTVDMPPSQIRLLGGDQLLIQGEREKVMLLDSTNIFRVIRPVQDVMPQPRRAMTSLMIFAFVILLSVFNLLPLSISALLGMFLSFIFRTITPEEAYRRKEWKVLILISCMLAFGQAMESTGTARFLASQVVHLVGDLPPAFLLGGFFILSMALTQPMSNQAAAVVVVPVAIQSAMQLGLNPRPFAIMIALGASCSFLTPLEPACLLVYGAGGYKFLDFTKVGGLLTIIILIISVLLVPVFWSF